MTLNMKNTAVKVDFTALTANTDTAFDFRGSDDRIVLVLNNGGTAQATLTVNAGNGIYGTTPLVLTVEKGISLLKLESGRFKNLSGNNAGKIVLNASAAISVGAVAIV